MHTNSKLLFQKYAKQYFRPGMRVLEIGPGAIPSVYQDLINDGSIVWHSLDIKHYPSLTYCAPSEYEFPIDSEAYDIVLSGQVLEHVRQIWVWIQEVSRVCKVGGSVITINPVSWPYHEAPVDCWRVFPEGMKALYEYASLQVMFSRCESLEANGRPHIPGQSAEWQTVRMRRAYKVLGLFGFPVECAYDTITIGERLATVPRPPAKKPPQTRKQDENGISPVTENAMPPLHVLPPPPSLNTRLRLKVKRISRALTGSRADGEWYRALSVAGSVEGWLHPDEERWLFDAAYSLSGPASIVEVGSFRGRSTCFLASGCRGTEKKVFAVDTFNGNDSDFGYRDFFGEFSENVKRAGLSKYVEPVVGKSVEVAKTWATPIHLLFIDGSHVCEDVLADFFGLLPHVVPGGVIAFHDVRNHERPGVGQAWTEIKQHLTGTGYCQSIGFGSKPSSAGATPTGSAT